MMDDIIEEDLSENEESLGCTETLVYIKPLQTD